MKLKPVGLTRDAGWQFGLRKTFSVKSSAMWDFLFSERLGLWLGEISDGLEEGRDYRTADGITGGVRVFKPYSHIRMDWRNVGWNNTSILQVRVMENADKCTVSFHQERLRNERQRIEMKKYWNERMAAIERAFD